MKVNKIIPFLTILLMSVLTNSCANVDDAEEYSNKFYQAMKEKDYEAIKIILDETMLENNSLEDISYMIVQKEALGEMVSFKKETGYNYQESNGLTVVRFLYTVEYTDATLYEYIRLTKRGKEYKVVNYGYYDNKEKRQEFIDHVEG